MDETISIRGARVHNLKNVSVDIPHNKITVITGVSGSGKSSLAFDTIYAEGQRRYVESLSSYARQFLERMEKPDVDEIDGIAPAIAIRQKTTTRNPRSTVATATECYDFLRLLFARIGQTFCYNCGRRVQRDTVERVVVALLAQPERSRWYVLFPVQKAASAEERNARLFDLRKKGYNRLFQDGRIFEFSTPESLLEIDFEQPLFVLADRLAISPDVRQRLADSVEIAYREAGEVVFEPAQTESATTGNTETPERLRFSEKFSCKYCGIDYREPEPILFSFNSPAGACPRCQGFGNTIDFSMELAIPNRSLSLLDGAVEPWTKPKGRDWFTDFQRRAKTKVRMDVPFCDLSEAEQDVVFASVREFFDHLETKKYKLHVRVFLSRYRGYAQCPMCHGARLRPEALWVRVGGETIAGVLKLNIASAFRFIDTLELTDEERAIADKVLVELRQRLRFLNDVGLDYLTLDRMASTLSGGESQRIQLATCLGSRLVGSCYVLDEPSIGLHARDTRRLVNILKELRDLGNTIVVVEHDPEVMRVADHIVDLGPGAGELGGNVLFSDSYANLVQDGNASLTARYLTGERAVTRSREQRRLRPERTLRFRGARIHNLKNVDFEIPLNALVVITGVSGSGKSTLVHDVIYRALANRPDPEAAAEEEVAEPVHKMYCRSVENASLVHEVVMIDQSPIGRTPRSNPVTYVKAFDIIRGIFAGTKDAERRGYSAGHFSFNVPGGRCEICQGDGTVSVEMQFLADVELVCEECKGTRFKSGILDVRYKGKNIHEVLGMTVTEAVTFFRETPRLVSKLQLLDEVGLGYLRLGQSATTLSGGEAQRVKLAARLADAASSGTLFLFDEPTTGLHFEDIAKLLGAFDRLLGNGGSLLVIEHNMDIIRAADWIIDMGPEGGDAGGEVIAVGRPEDVAREPRSHTGEYLRRLLT